jgi:hypothetical protein
MGCPLRSPLRILAKQVWPKWPRPTSWPSSYFALKFLGYPKCLSRGFSHNSTEEDCGMKPPALAPPAATPPAPPWLGFGAPAAALPWRLTRDDWMCLAGDGGGNGRLKRRSGVEGVEDA